MTDDQTLTQLFKTPSLQMLLEMVVIAAVATLVIMASRRALIWMAEHLHGQRRLRLLAVVPVLRLLIILATFVISVPVIVNPSLQNMVALLGAVSLAVGFALKDFVSSLVAGVVAVGEMPYRNGDWIEVQGVYGEVQHIGMRTVRLLTPDDTVVTIPHAKLWTEAIHNANDGSTRLQCVAEFYLMPGHDAALVRELLSDVALTSAYLHFGEPIVVVLQDQPWGTRYRLKAYPVDAGLQFQFISDLTVRAKARLTAAGVVFACAAPLAS